METLSTFHLTLTAKFDSRKIDYDKVVQSFLNAFEKSNPEKMTRLLVPGAVLQVEYSKENR